MVYSPKATRSEWLSFGTKLAIFYDENKLHFDDDDLLDQHAELDCYSATLNTLNL